MSVEKIYRHVGFSAHFFPEDQINKFHGGKIAQTTIEDIGGSVTESFEEAVKTAEKLVEKYREKFASLKPYIDPEVLDWDNDQEFYATFIASGYEPNPDGIKYTLYDRLTVKVENGIISRFYDPYGLNPIFNLEGKNFVDLPNPLKGIVINLICIKNIPWCGYIDIYVKYSNKNYIEVETSRKGLFIGKGGENIKKLQKMLGVRVKVV
jgi:hypothetical protein